MRLENLGRWHRLALGQIKIWWHCARLLRHNRAGTQAAALSYHTIFGIVPLAIVILLVFQSLPAANDAGQKLRELIYEQTNFDSIVYTTGQDGDDGIKLTDKIDSIVESFFQKLPTGSLAFFSGVIVIWAALALLMTIERSFNIIWRVPRGRKLISRVVNYWAVLTLGPVLFGVGVYASARFALSEHLGWLRVLEPVVPYLISVLGFFLLYLLMPNTRVRWKAALWGAIIAALAWAFAKWAFGLYLGEFIPFARLYGSIGVIPLTVLWIFVSWLIVLFGLQLTYATQNLQTLDQAVLSESLEAEKEEGHVCNEFVVFEMVRQICENFSNGKGATEGKMLCNSVRVPSDFGEKILERLVDAQILAKAEEPREGYLPGRDVEDISAGDIAEILRDSEFAGKVNRDAKHLSELMEHHMQMLRNASMRNLIEKTVNRSRVENNRDNINPS